MPTRSEEIEREIEDKRRDMSRTAAEIERRLRAENLVDGAVSWLRTSPGGRALADDVTDIVARNPLPVVLIGIGVLWMAYEMTRGGGSRSLDRYTPMRRRMGPDPVAERHHTHVESGGRAATPGQAPPPDEWLGRVPSGQSAREAAEAFRQAGTRTGAAPEHSPLGDAVDTGPVDATPDDHRPERVGIYDTDPDHPGGGKAARDRTG